MPFKEVQSKCDVITLWLQRLVSWCTHIMRHPTCPLARLWHIQQDSWLQARRDRFYSRPSCRVSVGFTSRWAEGWWAAVSEEEGLGWAVARGNKVEEARRVDFLREFILGINETQEDVLALEDGLLSIENASV